MEQQAEQPLPAAATSSSTQKADSVVVNIVIAANATTTSYGNGGGDCRVLDVKARPIDGGGGGGQDHHVVVDVDQRRLIVVNVASRDDPPPRRSRTTDDNAAVVTVQVGGGDREEEGDNQGTQICCVVCKEPAKWVAIGRCGHRVVCSTCMVRTRFFQRNKNCCVCRTPCPKVLVTKADGAAATALLSILPRFAFQDGRVGNYWYHGYTRAYFDEEKQYQAARAACEGIIEPWYHPPVFVALFFVFFLATGASLGYALSTEQKGWSQARTYIICISVGFFAASALWFPGACLPEDPEDLEAKRIEKLEKDRRIADIPTYTAI